MLRRLAACCAGLISAAPRPRAAAAIRVWRWRGPVC